jgi:hypothetical protein
MPVRRLPIRYAGFCERLMYHSLDSNLRAGRMSTVVNAEIVSEAEAPRLVAYAQAGWNFLAGTNFES